MGKMHCGISGEKRGHGGDWGGDLPLLANLVTARVPWHQEVTVRMLGPVRVLRLFFLPRYWGEAVPETTFHQVYFVAGCTDVRLLWGSLFLRDLSPLLSFPSSDVTQTSSLSEANVSCSESSLLLRSA